MNFSIRRLCEMVKLDFMREYCYKDIALKRLNVTLCLNVLNDARDDCIYAVTKFSQNESYCSLLEPENRDMCYYNLATVTEDQKYCNKTGYYIDFPDLCLMKIAYLSGDSSFCDRIQVNYTYGPPYLFGSLHSKESDV